MATRILSVRAGAFLLCFFASAAFAESSEFDRALEAFRAGHYVESEKLLSKLTSSHPENALVWFNLGNAEYSQGHFSEAIQSYERVIQLQSKLAPAAELYIAQALRESGKLEEAAGMLAKLRSRSLPPGISRALQAEAQRFGRDVLARGIELYQHADYADAARILRLSTGIEPDPEAIMMLGLSDLRLGLADEAHDAFMRVSKSSPEAEIQREANEFLAQLREGTYVSRPYWLWLDAAAGANSNVYAVGKSVGPVSEPIARLQAGTGYKLVQTRHIWWGASYSFLNDRVFNQPALDYYSHSFQLPYKQTESGWLLQASPQYRYERLGGFAYVSQMGGSLGVQKSVQEHDFGLSYLFLRNLGIASIYRYLTGNSQTLQAYWGYNQADYEFRVALIDAINHQGDFITSTSTLPLANTTRGPVVTGRYYLSDTWDVEGRAAFFWVNYDHLAEPDHIERSDKNLSTTLRLNYRLLANLKLYVSDEYALNRSTLTESNTTNKNYSQNIALVGATWDVF